MTPTSSAGSICRCCPRHFRSGRSFPENRLSPGERNSPRESRTARSLTYQKAVLPMSSRANGTVSPLRRSKESKNDHHSPERAAPEITRRKTSSAVQHRKTTAILCSSRQHAALCRLSFSSRKIRRRTRLHNPAENACFGHSSGRNSINRHHPSLRRCRRYSRCPEMPTALRTELGRLRWACAPTPFGKTSIIRGDNNVSLYCPLSQSLPKCQPPDHPRARRAKRSDSYPAR